MEEQLAAYRARKAKEQAEQNTNQASWFSLRQRNEASNKATRCRDHQTEENAQTVNQHRSISGHPLNQDSRWFSMPRVIANSRLAYYISQDTSLLTNVLFLKFILWLALLGFFVLAEFAAVFIVVTIFYVMYVNMRSGGDDSARKPGELSAYSVFNPDCQRIDGTLTAEQFERELRHGLGST